jgi:hypothetical protein
MLVEGDTLLGAVQKLRQEIFAFLDGCTSQVVAIKLDKIESAKQGSMVMVPVAQQFEHREAALIDHNGFTVDETRPHRQAGDGCNDRRKPAGEICA